MVSENTEAQGGRRGLPPDLENLLIVHLYELINYYFPSGFL